MRMSVSTQFKVSVKESLLDPADLEGHIDAVMEILIDRGIDDPTLGGSLASGEIEIAVDVEARNPTHALKRAFEIMLSAIEQSGGRVIDSLGEPVRSRPEEPAVNWDRRGVGVAA